MAAASPTPEPPEQSGLFSSLMDDMVGRSSGQPGRFTRINSVGLFSKAAQPLSDFTEPLLDKDKSRASPFDTRGLSSVRADRHLSMFGRNELPSTKRSPMLVLLTVFFGPLPVIVWLCVALEALQPQVDWFSAWLLGVLWLVHGCVGWYEYLQSAWVAETLRTSLTTTTPVKRDGKWVSLDTRLIVPGDLVKLTLGCAVPADCRVVSPLSTFAFDNIVEAEGSIALKAARASEDEALLSVDLSAITGESHNMSMSIGDTVPAGALLNSGEALASVVRTGPHTVIGRSLALLRMTPESGLGGRFRLIVIRIVLCTLALAILLVGTLLGDMINAGTSFPRALSLCSVLLVASVPHGVFAVCTFVMALGSRKLADKTALVRRLSCIEQVAALEVLCVDKTGTLTENSYELMRVQPFLDGQAEPVNLRSMAPRGNVTSSFGHVGHTADLLSKLALRDNEPDAISPEARQLLLYSLLSCAWDEPAANAIDAMLFEILPAFRADLGEFERKWHRPFHPASKFSESCVRRRPLNKNQPEQVTAFRVIKGAPDVIAMLVQPEAGKAGFLWSWVEKSLATAAAQGQRCLAVAHMAVSEGGSGPEAGEAPVPEEWVYDGLLHFSDPPRDDSRFLVDCAHDLGLQVKMITGDHVSVAKEICHLLGLGHNVLQRHDFPKMASIGLKEVPSSLDQFGAVADAADGFAGVDPDQKALVTDVLRARGWVTGMLGDGMNDAAAMKRADVGVAVNNSADAAKACADVVLLGDKLTAFIDCILACRDIISRIRHYLRFRVGASLHLLLFFFSASLMVSPAEVFPPPPGQRLGAPAVLALPVTALVVIVILTDLAMLAVSLDYKTCRRNRPSRWNMPPLLLACVSAGVVNTAGSLMWLLLLLRVCGGSPKPDLLSAPAEYLQNILPIPDYPQLCTLVFLQILVADCLSIFATRSMRLSLIDLPAAGLVCASLLAMCLGSLLSVLWPDTNMVVVGVHHHLRPVTWQWVGIIWAYCWSCFFVLDFLKASVSAVVQLATGVDEGTEVYHDAKPAMDHAVRKQTSTAKHHLRRTAMNIIAEDKIAKGRPLHQPRVSEQMPLPQVLERIKELEVEIKTLRTAVIQLQEPEHRNIRLSRSAFAVSTASLT